MKEIECYFIDIKKYKINKYLRILYAVGFVLSFASVVTTRFGGKSIFQIYSVPIWLHVVVWVLMIFFFLFLLNSLFETYKRKMWISKDRILIEGRMGNTKYEVKYMREIFLKPEYNLDFPLCSTLSFDYQGSKKSLVIQAERNRDKEFEELFQQIKGAYT